MFEVRNYDFWQFILNGSIDEIGGGIDVDGVMDSKEVEDL